jgi:phosphoribosylamine---glycine ligase
MKILVIGSGGREHALAWRLLQSLRVSKVYVAPGNAGTAGEDGLENVALTAFPDLIDFVNKNNILLTVVGPEAPLAEGVVDAFQAAGLRIFGPTQRAAQLESSKDFSKRFMQRHGIPTTAHATFSDAAAAHSYIDAQGAPIVIKADGLAAGKGVVVATSLAEAHAAVDMMLVANKMGASGSRRISTARKQVSSCSPTARTRWRWPAARITSTWVMATQGRTPAAWARIRRRRWLHPVCTPG